MGCSLSYYYKPRERCYIRPMAVVFKLIGGGNHAHTHSAFHEGCLDNSARARRDGEGWVSLSRRDAMSKAVVLCIKFTSPVRGTPPRRDELFKRHLQHRCHQEHDTQFAGADR